jgi:hypothetical protein
MKRAQLHRMTGAGATSARFLTDDDAQPGVFGSLLRLRREAQHREAQADRERRLVELDRNIASLEAWHHSWRLKHDEDYRALHPGEWCDRHRGPSTECTWRAVCHLPSHYRELRSGYRAVGNSAPSPTLSVEDRRAATRTMAAWGRGDHA